MIDYVNTEIVAYSDGMPSFNEAYPSVLPMIYNTTYNTPYYNGWLSFDMRMTDSYISSDSEWVTGLGAEPRIIAFLIRKFGDKNISENDALSSVGVCYYVHTSYNVGHDPAWGVPNGTYMRIAKADIPANIKNPYTGVFNVEGEDVFWLYNFGSALFSRASFFSEILDFNIGGYNILSLLFSTGFLVYMGWAVIKWAIPL